MFIGTLALTTLILLTSCPMDFLPNNVNNITSNDNNNNIVNNNSEVRVTAMQAIAPINNHAVRYRVVDDDSHLIITLHDATAFGYHYRVEMLWVGNGATSFRDEFYLYFDGTNRGEILGPRWFPAPINNNGITGNQQWIAGGSMAVSEGWSWVRINNEWIWQGGTNSVTAPRQPRVPAPFYDGNRHLMVSRENAGRPALTENGDSVVLTTINNRTNKTIAVAPNSNYEWPHGHFSPQPPLIPIAAGASDTFTTRRTTFNIRLYEGQ